MKEYYAKRCQSVMIKTSSGVVVQCILLEGHNKLVHHINNIARDSYKWYGDDQSNYVGKHRIGGLPS